MLGQVGEQSNSKDVNLCVLLINKFLQWKWSPSGQKTSQGHYSEAVFLMASQWSTCIWFNIKYRPLAKVIKYHLTKLTYIVANITRIHSIAHTASLLNQPFSDMTLTICSTQCGSSPGSSCKTNYFIACYSGVNMFAMLTGNLPFTVEPFSVRALLNKMMSGHMNELPSHLSKRKCMF